MSDKKVKLRKVKQFTVYEDMWGTAPDNATPLLDGDTNIHTNNGLCCLGFACLAAGAKPQDIVNKDMPANIGYGWLTDPSISKKEFFYSDHNSALACEAANINDDDDTSKEEKKEALRKLFKKHGVSIHFVPKASKTFRSKIERVLLNEAEKFNF